MPVGADAAAARARWRRAVARRARRRRGARRGALDRRRLPPRRDARSTIPWVGAVARAIAARARPPARARRRPLRRRHAPVHRPRHPVRDGRPGRSRARARGRRVGRRRRARGRRAHDRAAGACARLPDPDGHAEAGSRCWSGSLAAVAVGCGGDEDGTSTAATGEPRRAVGRSRRRSADRRLAECQPRRPALFMATNTGLFRIPEGASKPERSPAAEYAGRRRQGLGGARRALHRPGQAARLGPSGRGRGAPAAARAHRSEDAGKTWSLGVRARHGRLPRDRAVRRHDWSRRCSGRRRCS